MHDYNKHFHLDMPALCYFFRKKKDVSMKNLIPAFLQQQAILGPFMSGLLTSLFVVIFVRVPALAVDVAFASRYISHIVGNMLLIRNIYIHNILSGTSANSYDHSQHFQQNFAKDVLILEPLSKPCFYLCLCS